MKSRKNGQNPKEFKALEQLLAAVLGQKKARVAVGVLALLAGLFYSFFGAEKLQQNDYEQYQIDSRFAPYFASCERLLDRFFYANCYSDELRGTRAVAYVLHGPALERHEAKRPNFEPDLKLPKSVRTEWADYLHSGFDRGHVLSNQSMNASKIAQKSTFLMSNITPQWPEVNRGIWLEIERRERALARKWGAAQVLNIVGYAQSPKRLKKGVRAAIPSSYAKAICQAQTKRGEDGKLKLVPGDAAGGDFSGCECYQVANEEHPRAKDAAQAKIPCGRLAAAH